MIGESGTRTPGQPGGDAERGSVTAFLAIVVIGLLVLAGLVVDGGAKVRAIQRADRTAAEAGRAAAQAIDVVAARSGSGIAVDRSAAVAAAQQFLDSSGVRGSVRVLDRSTLDVVTHVEIPTVFLGLVGVRTFTVEGRAEVTLVHTPTGGQR